MNSFDEPTEKTGYLEPVSYTHLICICVAYFFDFSIFYCNLYRYGSIKAFCLSLIYAIFIADRSIFLRFLCRFWRWGWSWCGRITVSCL